MRCVVRYRRPCAPSLGSAGEKCSYANDVDLEVQSDMSSRVGTRAEDGEPLLITKRGVPMAQVLPAPPPAPQAESAFGCMAGTAEEVEDIVAPLLVEEWEVLR